MTFAMIFLAIGVACVAAIVALASSRRKPTR